MEDTAIIFERRPEPAGSSGGARRRLAIDLVVAFGLAIVFVAVAGGLGVVAFFGVPILLLGLLSLALERVFTRQGRRSGTVSTSRRR